MCSQLIKTTIFLTIGGIVLLVPQTHSLNITECMGKKNLTIFCMRVQNVHCNDRFAFCFNFQISRNHKFVIIAIQNMILIVQIPSNIHITIV